MQEIQEAANRVPVACAEIVRLLTPVMPGSSALLKNVQAMQTGGGDDPDELARMIVRGALCCFATTAQYGDSKPKYEALVQVLVLLGFDAAKCQHE